MTDFNFAAISCISSKKTYQTLWRSAGAGIQNKLVTGTVIVIHSEKEAFVVKNTGNIKKNFQKLSEVAPLDNIYCANQKTQLVEKNLNYPLRTLNR